MFTTSPAALLEKEQSIGGLPKIDFHTHAFKDSIAERTMQKLQALSGYRAYGEGTMASLKKRMEDNGICASVLLNIATSPKSVKAVNDFAIAEHNGKDVFSFGSLHPDNAEYKEEIARLKAAGIRGIKFHPCYQGFMINDKAAYPLYEAIAEAGMIALFHAGFDPMNMGRSYATPKASREVHRDFPGLTMVLAHGGGIWEEAEVETHLYDEEVYFDVAMLGTYPEVLLRVIKGHGAERVLFGSDFPWHDREELDALLALPIGEGDKRRVFYENAAKLLGIEGDK